MAELVDAYVSGAYIERCAGSTPVRGTQYSLNLLKMRVKAFSLPHHCPTESFYPTLKTACRAMETARNEPCPSRNDSGRSTAGHKTKASAGRGTPWRGWDDTGKSQGRRCEVSDCRQGVGRELARNLACLDFNILERIADYCKDWPCSAVCAD